MQHSQDLYAVLWCNCGVCYLHWGAMWLVILSLCNVIPNVTHWEIGSPTRTVSYPAHVVHVWPWLVLDLRDVHTALDTVVVHQEVSTLLLLPGLWLCGLYGGRGWGGGGGGGGGAGVGGGDCVKWSLEEQRPNTLSPQASGQGTIEGIHAHSTSCTHPHTHKRLILE